MSQTVAKYGTWKSPLSAELATANYVSFSELVVDQEDLYFLESRPQEAGRTTLRVRRPDGTIKEITPAPFNVRTKVHEYGGSSYTAINGLVFFVNADDQDIYCTTSESIDEPRRVTTSGSNERFANLTFDKHHDRLLCVREHHIKGRVHNDLVQVDVNTGYCQAIHAEHDFYGQPSLTDCGSKLAFLAWDLPNMPWDSTLLYVANFNEIGNVLKITQVAGGSSESIFQPEWTGSDRLMFISDRSGYWNLYQYVGNQFSVIVEDKAEYGHPLWVLSARSYVILDDNRVVSIRQTDEGQTLVLIELRTGSVDTLNSDYSSYMSLARFTDRVLFVSGSPNQLTSIVSLDVTDNSTKDILTSGVLPLTPGYVSEAESISYRNNQDQVVYANYYPPKNEHHVAPEGDRPPLLVLSHGGPTSHSNASFRFHVQYYTTRGWAVLDVNYGGSTGYGREYRNRLINNWGIVDVEDCEAGVRFLCAEKKADIDRIAIRGGSAGGYTTLRALTTGATFKAGSSLYGVADVRALAAETHKFESRYLDSLIPVAEMEARSPINHIDKLSVPVIFFQGIDDRVVPPNQSESMYQALAAKGLTTALFLFPDEGHGFRAGAHVRTVMQSEFAFFSKVFGIERDDLDFTCFDSAQLVNATW